MSSKLRFFLFAGLSLAASASGLAALVAWETYVVVTKPKPPIPVPAPVSGPMRDYIDTPAAVTYRGVQIGLCVYRGSADQPIRELTQQVLNAIDVMIDQAAIHDGQRRASEVEREKTKR